MQQAPRPFSPRPATSRPAQRRVRTVGGRGRDPLLDDRAGRVRHGRDEAQEDRQRQSTHKLHNAPPVRAIPPPTGGHGSYSRRSTGVRAGAGGARGATRPRLRTVRLRTLCVTATRTGLSPGAWAPYSFPFEDFRSRRMRTSDQGTAAAMTVTEESQDQGQAYGPGIDPSGWPSVSACSRSSTRSTSTTPTPSPYAAPPPGSTARSSSAAVRSAAPPRPPTTRPSPRRPPPAPPSASTTRPRASCPPRSRSRPDRGDTPAPPLLLRLQDALRRG